MPNTADTHPTMGPVSITQASAPVPLGTFRMGPDQDRFVLAALTGDRHGLFIVIPAGSATPAIGTRLDLAGRDRVVRAGSRQALSAHVAMFTTDDQRARVDTLMRDWLAGRH